MRRAFRYNAGTNIQELVFPLLENSFDIPTLVCLFMHGYVSTAEGYTYHTMYEKSYTYDISIPAVLLNCHRAYRPIYFC